jgi:hypothetical protein
VGSVLEDSRARMEPLYYWVFGVLAAATLGLLLAGWGRGGGEISGPNAAGFAKLRNNYVLVYALMMGEGGRISSDLAISMPRCLTCLDACACDCLVALLNAVPLPCPFLAEWRSWGARVDIGQEGWGPV